MARDSATLMVSCWAVNLNKWKTHVWSLTKLKEPAKFTLKIRNSWGQAQLISLRTLLHIRGVPRIESQGTDLCFTLTHLPAQPTLIVPNLTWSQSRKALRAKINEAIRSASRADPLCLSHQGGDRDASGILASQTAREGPSRLWLTGWVTHRKKYLSRIPDHQLH